MRDLTMQFNKFLLFLNMLYNDVRPVFFKKKKKHISDLGERTICDAHTSYLMLMQTVFKFSSYFLQKKIFVKIIEKT